MVPRLVRVGHDLFPLFVHVGTDLIPSKGRGWRWNHGTNLIPLFLRGGLGRIKRDGRWRYGRWRSGWEGLAARASFFVWAVMSGLGRGFGWEGLGRERVSTGGCWAGRGFLQEGCGRTEGWAIGQEEGSCGWWENVRARRRREGRRRHTYCS